MLMGLVSLLTTATVGADTGRSPANLEPPVTSQIQATPTEPNTAQTKARIKREKTLEQPQPFVRRHQRELLGLLGLLILWLITRLVGQEETRPNRPGKRHSPLNADELARVIFSVVRGEQVSEYKGLYLTGSEAVQVMGEASAGRYLEQRTPDVFALAFDALFDCVPPNSRFEKGHLNEHDVAELWVIDDRGQRHRIPVGQITHIGAVLRIIAPASGPLGETKIEPIETNIPT
jgi:hypothetical protein